MCELFAFSSKNDMDITNYLKEFYSHSEKHPNGWGLSYLDSSEIKLYKESKKAVDSDKLRNILSNKIITRNAIAHIRLATVGDMKPCNCHPFEKMDNNDRTWTLVHNGTIFHYPAIDSYKNKQAGQTDSERILLYIVDCVNESEIDTMLDNYQLCELINNILTNLSKNNKLNIILYTQDMLFIHINCKESLYYYRENEFVIFSTLALNNSNWHEVKLNTLYVIKNSNVVFMGKDHGNEYVIKDEDVDFILNNLDDKTVKELLDSYGNMNNVKKQILNSHK